MNHDSVSFLLTHSNGEYHNYSTTRPLLEILNDKKFEIFMGCLVKKIRHEHGKAVSLETSKGELTLGRAKLVPLPATPLMLNSFPPSLHPQLEGIGTRFTAHFISTVTARIPCTDDSPFCSLVKQAREGLESAVLYVAGQHKESGHQFHIQLTAVYMQDGVNYDVVM